MASDWSFSCLALYFTGPVGCPTVSIPEKSVNTTVGRNITLLCLYRTEAEASNLHIQWSFYSAKQKLTTIHSPCHYMDEKSISHCRKTVYMTDARGRCSWRYKIYYWQQGQSYSYGHFKGRIQGASSSGNASITIFNMQPSETGIYTCEVFNPADTNAQNEKSVSVGVLVPPSKPLCSFGQNHQIEMGHLITLSCLSETGLPNPAYYWDRVSGDTVTPVTEQYNPQTGLLVMGNVTKFEEGYYRCTAVNPLGNSTCHIDLTTKHSQGGIIVGALIGAILAAALICVVVWVLASKEKKKKRKEKAATSEMQDVTHKEPLNTEYAALPSQESVPVAAVPPSKESNEYVTPEEIEVAAMPENETQEMGHHPVA
ncbi:V-set and immunoglobulin domain-containing protein 1 [Rhineura floridana]|uniref:V-set and immunoglobulin domain-containing protein 1 n=1 Tax=Rhineura floridana TaxID=261503 RepID=UPI002AC880F8|nr:V-set and immunoglobulin domain-containing protein 1 [Rhineura floridana]